MISGEFSSPLSVGIYDHALFMAGGGQRYACALASLLQSNCRVTFITHRAISVEKLEAWYDLDLSECAVKVIPIPYYEKRPHGLIDESFLPWFGLNPFEPVSCESKNYDLFINANMLTKVTPQSKTSVFICHFPDHPRSRYFAADRYTTLVTSSQYGADWIQKKWGLPNAKCISPPVEMGASQTIKEPLILSVARFEHTGSKNQLEMIRVFEELCRQYPVEMRAWTLGLAGGTFEGNPYFAQVRKRAKNNSRIHILPNLSIHELKKLYARASLFWHACGLNTEDPARAEHFGMTTVEAMQNRCVPVVINKGGQREIVEQDVSGFLFDDSQDLARYTLLLIRNIEKREVMAGNASKRGLFFGKFTFEQKWLNLLAHIKKREFYDRKKMLVREF